MDVHVRRNTHIDHIAEGNEDKDPYEVNNRIMIRPSEDAREVWRKHHNVIEALMDDFNDLEDYDDIGSKASDHTARLAAIFAVIEDPEGMEQGKKISADIMRRAAAVTEWHIRCALLLFGNQENSKQNEDAERLKKWMVRQAKNKQVSEFTRRHATQSGPFQGDNKRLDSCLERLTDLGLIRRVQRGRKIFFQIHPELING